MNGGVGTIDLGAGITQSDLTFQSDDSTGNLTILDGTAGDSIVVNNDLYNYYGTTSHLGELTFSDGSTFNLNQPLTFTWSATAADTTLAGSDYGANVFNLVAGSDSVTFGNGSLGGSNWNAVNYAAGDGALTVNMNGGVGTIDLGAGITQSDLTFQSDDSTGNLTILDGTAGDSIVVNNDLYNYYGTTSHLGELTFSDGSTFNLNQPLTFTWSATAVDTTLAGSDYGANVFNLVAGSDSVTFGNGSLGGSNWNAVNYVSGDGALTVNMNGGVGTIDLGAGITQSDLTFQSDDSTGNLTILDGTAGDSIVVQNDLYNHYGTTSHLGTLTFADGSTFNLNQPLTFTWSATAVDTTLAGSDYGANVFNLVAGSDSVTFGNGSLGGSNWNAVNYAAGDGALTVNMNGAPGALELAPDVKISDLVFGQNAQGNETLSVDGSGDVVTFTNVNSAPLVDINYDGGTYAAHVGNTSNNSLYGSGAADVFDGEGGSDYEQGNGGGDTFIYNSGYGQLEINESGSGLNVLQLGSGITAADMQVTDDRNGNIYLTDGTSGDRIQLDSELGGTGQGVNQVQFADGTSWTQAQLVTMATTGTSAGQALYGNGSANVFDSKGLATYEQGNGGGDTFIYDVGSLPAGGNAALQLFDTGVGADGAPLALGTLDTNWTLVNDAAGTAAYTTNYGSPWLGADGVSDFINPGGSAAPLSEPGGIHIYQTTFTIPDGVDPTNLRISGQFAADNWVQAIVLNGQTNSAEPDRRPQQLDSVRSTKFGSSRRGQHAAVRLLQRWSRTHRPAR